MTRTLHLPGSPAERRAASVTVAALALRASEHCDPLVEARTVLAALGLNGDADRPVRGALASGTAWRSGHRP